MDGPPRRPPRRREVLVPQAAEVVVGPDGAPDGPRPPSCRSLRTCELVPVSLAHARAVLHRCLTYKLQTYNFFASSE